MGRGDRKSKKGKIFKGSFGVIRTRKKKAEIITTKKKAADKTTVVKKKKNAKK